MPATSTATRCAWTPLTIGFFLWSGATALLCEDVMHTGQVTVQHALMPLLTASTVAAAVFAHKRFRAWKPLGFLMFAALAVLGSGLTIYSTIGRVASTNEGQASEARAGNEALQRKLADLDHAKAEQKKECRVIGKRCSAWNARVDQITAELDGKSTRAENPRIDAAVMFITTLTNADAGKVRAIIAALEPVSLPLFLEFGSIVFFAAAFPHRKQLTLSQPTRMEKVESVQLCLEKEESVQPFQTTREQALTDLRKLNACGSQRFLADKWGVSEGQVSKWMQGWERDGQIDRTRNGKSKATLALPPPAPERRRLGHMARIN